MLKSFMNATHRPLCQRIFVKFSEQFIDNLFYFLKSALEVQVLECS